MKLLKNYTKTPSDFKLALADLIKTSKQIKIETIACPNNPVAYYEELLFKIQLLAEEESMYAKIIYSQLEAIRALRRAKLNIGIKTDFNALSETTTYNNLLEEALSYQIYFISDDKNIACLERLLDNNIIVMEGRDNLIDKFSVWAGGTEVSDYHLNHAEAKHLAKCYENNGYTDVAIQKVEQGC